MSRSLHYRYHHGERCPFLPETAHRWRAPDLGCHVAAVDHPGGVCPARDLGRTQVREGDLTLTRHAPVDHARRHYREAYSGAVTTDNRRVRRGVAKTLGRLAGRSAGDAVECWDDGMLLDSPNRGISWDVC